MDEKQESVRMTLRLPVKVNETVEKAAKDLGITKNAYIVMVLQNKVKK